MPNLSAVSNLPDISFIDGKTIDDVKSEMVADFETYMTNATGQTVSLELASPHRACIYAAAAQLFQSLQYIDRAGKQSLIKYSYADFLDNLAALKGITRAAAKAATTTLRFTIAATRTSATAIPAGTRVSSSGSVYFATDEYAEIPAGSLTVDVGATCTTTGTAGNGITAGELSTLVDPIAYISAVANLTETAGGAEIESDDALAERVYLAPSSYSTAGPEDGYIYWVKQYSTAIGDVKVTSDQAAGTVGIVFILSDGSAPGEELLENVQTFLQSGSVRPMTDLVTVAAPTEATYTVNLSYYINRSDSAQAVTIQEAVQTAVANYVTWQRKIGRDINPSKLLQLVMAAGAKRVSITAPTYVDVSDTSVAALSGTAQIIYGGLEDD